MAYDPNSLPDLLPVYYKRLFPHGPYFRWLHYGGGWCSASSRNYEEGVVRLICHRPLYSLTLFAPLLHLIQLILAEKRDHLVCLFEND